MGEMSKAEPGLAGSVGPDGELEGPSFNADASSAQADRTSAAADNVPKRTFGDFTVPP